MDHLWSPWRLEYVKAHKPDTECVFCRAIGASAEAADALGEGALDPLVVFQGRTAYVILNRYPYNNGHLMVVTRRHVATLIDLTSDELHEIALLTQRSE